MPRAMKFSNITRRPNLFKNDVSETGICLRPQVKPTLLDPTERIGHSSSSGLPTGLNSEGFTWEKRQVSLEMQF
jgi:hypothetical protein